MVQKRILVKRVTGTAEHVFNLVPEQIFYAGARRAKVFARVEFLRGFGENFADAGGHGEKQVGVNVDLRATHTARDFDVGFGHALGIGILPPYLLISSTRYFGTLDAPWSTSG